MNRWFFWVLAPLMLVTAISLPFLIKPPTWQGIVLLYAICGVLMAATLGLADTKRFPWALRCVAVAVVFAYSAYVVSEGWAWWQGKPFGFWAPRSRPNLFNAVKGFIFFAIPSIIFILRGRSGTAVDVLLSEEPSLEEPGLEGRPQEPVQTRSGWPADTQLKRAAEKRGSPSAIA